MKIFKNNKTNWHGCWHVGKPSLNIGPSYGTFIGTLARKNEKLARFWHISHTGTQGVGT